MNTGGGGANRIIYTTIVNIMLRTEVPLVPLVINTRRYFALVETFQPCSSDLNERRTTLLQSPGDYLIINN